MARCSALALSCTLVAAAVVAALGCESLLAAEFRPADPLESAKAAIRVKEYPRAAADLQRQADAGNAEAQYQLGTFALNGLLGERDIGEARKWLTRAATAGHARAAFSLAALLASADPPDV